MPLIKPISGHTNVAGVRRYLTKGDRALAADYLNLDYDSRIERVSGSLPVAYDWAREMDSTRAMNNGNDPWRGKRARTYKHYIISPDPNDRISLDRLRELALAWAQESFGDYQVAIVYHDDNEGRIPHAHVIVNNVNLETGHRLQDPRPELLNRRLQAMAAERSLKGFGTDDGMHDGFQALAAKEAGRKPPLSRQRVYVRKAEAEITAKGEYSWLADIRARVSVAKDIASDEAEFRDVLFRLEIDVADNSPRCDRRDWIYGFADHPTQRASGERLGLAFGCESIRSGFVRTDRTSLGEESRNRIVAIARSAIEIRDLGELGKLARTLQVNARYEIDCMDDYGYAIEEAKAAGDFDQIAAIAAARDFASRKGLLPEQASVTRPRSQATGYADQSCEADSETSRATSTERERNERRHEDWER